LGGAIAPASNGLQAVRLIPFIVLFENVALAQNVVFVYLLGLLHLVAIPFFPFLVFKRRFVYYFLA